MRTYSTNDTLAAYQSVFRQAVKQFLLAKELANRIRVGEAKTALWRSSASSESDVVRKAVAYAEWFNSLQGHLEEPLMCSVFRFRYLQPHKVVEKTCIDGVCVRESCFYAVRPIPDVARRLHVPIALIEELDGKIAQRLGEIILRASRSRLQPPKLPKKRDSIRQRPDFLRAQIDLTWSQTVGLDQFGHEFRRQTRNTPFDFDSPLWVAIRVGHNVSLPTVMAVIYDYFTGLLAIPPERLCFYDCRVAGFSEPDRTFIILTQFSSPIPLLEL